MLPHSRRHRFTKGNWQPTAHRWEKPNRPQPPAKRAHRKVIPRCPLSSRSRSRKVQIRSRLGCTTTARPREAAAPLGDVPAVTAPPIKVAPAGQNAHRRPHASMTPSLAQAILHRPGGMSEGERRTRRRRCRLGFTRWRMPLEAAGGTGGSGVERRRGDPPGSLTGATWEGVKQC